MLTQLGRRPNPPDRPVGENMPFVQKRPQILCTGWYRASNLTSIRALILYNFKLKNLRIKLDYEVTTKIIVHYRPYAQLGVVTDC